MSTSLKLKKVLEERLNRPEWQLSYDRENEQLRIEHKEHQKGITLSLPGLTVEWQKKKDAFLDELVYHVEEALNAIEASPETKKEKNIFPVIRSTSFPTESPEGDALIHEEHTAETSVFYALDLGNTYRLISEKMLQDLNISREQLMEIARFNVRSLDTEMKRDEVAGNTFYFINHNDGYDASRILNSALLDRMEKEVSGTLAAAVPHQDVLILADIRNNQGYDILAQMAMQFFMNGRVPVTALPFLYENGELEPVFILAKNKPVDETEGE
ncbi:DUF1444 domain-containing protein [Fictibacillus sp. WQ 8-8]|uniref:DUF1444 domain-containing protein n=1 Tax=unclassified Fictibacillus TaxID=2644029 RepID=UPI0006A7C74D|nr:MULTISPECIES: DUF1444 domain-containing protein [unclassified Fictibacillus]MCQ6266611.1 DUF1444 domain-containing protein [Fictibacillus sp. WQ 8-8]MED2971457.1 DUF1444 domain-containing protein [Fictibacillus sp. B-59209]UZJ80263.1 DUF1444 domain-containing protein [Fictibacillus sp. KU28468]